MWNLHKLIPYSKLEHFFCDGRGRRDERQKSENPGFAPFAVLYILYYIKYHLFVAGGSMRSFGENPTTTTMAGEAGVRYTLLRPPSSSSAGLRVPSAQVSSYSTSTLFTRVISVLCKVLHTSKILSKSRINGLGFESRGQWKPKTVPFYFKYQFWTSGIMLCYFVKFLCYSSYYSIRNPAIVTALLMLYICNCDSF